MDKKWFTLIEIIIATGILTVSVFWVFKLISENNKIIENSNNYLNSTLLINVAENCIENTLINASRYISLWLDLKNCNMNSGEVINIIDWIEYTIRADLQADTATWKIWEITVFNEYIWDIKSIFIQK